MAQGNLMYTAWEVDQFVTLVDKMLYVNGAPIEHIERMGVHVLTNGFVSFVIDLVINNGDIKLELPLLPQYREQVEAKYGKLSYEFPLTEVEDKPATGGD